MTAPGPARLAVFTGAGTSGDAPASLPRGFALRDDILRVLHGTAREVVPEHVTEESLTELLASQRKLEVVLGRLWGTIGPDALRCLLALRIELPNEAHMLAALHLVHGGMHVTLNFDIGIELAYQLLTGRVDLPTVAPDDYRSLLPAWQALVPADPPPLRVVVSQAEFERWVGDGEPPALLKVHGSLTFDQLDLVDVVAVDIEELGQLPAARLSAVEALGAADRLLITGYSGADPDVYEPLLGAAEHTTAIWSCFRLDSDSPVLTNAPRHGIELRLGDPDGLAVTNLRHALDLPAPAWPRMDVPGSGYRTRFDAWAQWLREHQPPSTLTRAWAWLIADLGDLDTALSILQRLLAEGDDDWEALLRYAELLYNRARGDDRRRAAALFRRGAHASNATTAQRNHCRIRLADVARGQVTRERALSPRTTAFLAKAIAGPVRVLITTRFGRSDTEAAADALRALQQTGLRVAEAAAARLPAVHWHMLAMACHSLTRLGRRAESLANNGNRRALIRTHRLALRALATLLTGQAPPRHLLADLRRLRNAYLTADDLPGAGNCTVSMALANARRDPDLARSQLAEARGFYVAGRPDDEPIAAGAALLAVAARLLTRAEALPRSHLRGEGTDRP